MKKAVLAALAFVTVLCLHRNANADELIATFETAVGNAPVPGVTATLKLNPDGTISATATSLSNWQLIGFGLDSAAEHESGSFSSPSGVSNTIFGTSFGYFWTSWIQSGQGVQSMTWVIGSPGTFTSVFDVINGSNSPYDGFAFVLNLQPFGVTEYAAHFTAVPAVPEPETCALFMAGLGAIALLNRRKVKAPARAT